MKRSGDCCILFQLTRLSNGAVSVVALSVLLHFVFLTYVQFYLIVFTHRLNIYLAVHMWCLAYHTYLIICVQLGLYSFALLINFVFSYLTTVNYAADFNPYEHKVLR